MNNTFNSSRFYRLLHKQWIENRYLYLISTAILFGALCLFYLIFIVTDNYNQFGNTGVTKDNAHLFFRYSELNFRQSLFALAGVLYLTLLSGHYFAVLGKPATAIQELILPVSATERWLVAFLFSTCLTLLSFAVVFLAVDVIFVGAMGSIYRDSLQEASAFDPIYNYNDHDWGFQPFLQISEQHDLFAFTIIGLLLSSLFTLGSVYFPRLPFIKTALVAILLLGLSIGLNSLTEFLMASGKVEVNHAANSATNRYIGFVLLTSISLLWVALHFRLKEKEV